MEKKESKLLLINGTMEKAESSWMRVFQAMHDVQILNGGLLVNQNRQQSQNGLYGKNEINFEMSCTDWNGL